MVFQKDDLDTLAHVRDEMKRALVDVLNPEAMSFVDRYVAATVSFEKASLKAKEDRQCEEQMQAAVAEALRLPPPEIFIGTPPASFVVQAYLRWIGEPTTVRKIASDAYERGWRRKSTDGRDDVYKSINAGIASHTDRKEYPPGIEQPKLFRYTKVDKHTTIVSLLEWDQDQSSNLP